MKALRACKYCGEIGTHLEFTCFKKPKKPMQAKKRMRKIGKVTDQWIKTKHKWFQQNKAPYYLCYYCNKLLTKSQLTLDHMESRSRRPDLRYSLSNLVPCCWDCNTEKGSRSAEDYLNSRRTAKEEG